MQGQTRLSSWLFFMRLSRSAAVCRHRWKKFILLLQKKGCSLDQADYKASSAIAGKLTRYQVTLPIRGGYSNIHKFLVQVLRDIPTASLERVLFERKKINDSSVDATVTFVLHLGPEL